MLRVIAGKYRSRKIKEVKSKTTRPTTDKNKEALFNSLGQYFDSGVMLDLFAGSGALGIEGYSRGIGKVYFVENNYNALKVIKENISILEIDNNDVEVIKSDAFIFLGKTDNTFDIIVADPPYALDCYLKILELINSRQLLNKNGIIVMESDKNNVLPEHIGNIFKEKEKVLGNTKFTYYKMEA